MKKHRSRFLSGLLVVAMVAALAIPAAAEMVQLSATTGVTIYVDDQKVDPRNYPRNKGPQGRNQLENRYFRGFKCF